jgi:DNA-binding protein HU-beta
MAKARRTTHRSSKGTKLYAVRDASGQFKDIQTYKRAHRADVAKTSKAEKVTGKTARKKAAGRKTAKKR